MLTIPNVKSDISKYVEPFTVIIRFPKTVLPRINISPLKTAAESKSVNESFSIRLKPYKIKAIMKAVKNFDAISKNILLGRKIVSEVKDAKMDANKVRYVLTLILRKNSDKRMIKKSM